MNITSIRYGLSEEYAIDVLVQGHGDKGLFDNPLDDPIKQYKDFGFIIVRNLIHPTLCDAVINDFLQEVKPYEGGLFRQISMLKVPHKFKHGLMTNGFLNTQDLTIFPQFRANSIEIIANPRAQRIIRELSGWYPTLIESTFWESTSVGTPLHRDGDYVNSAVRSILTAMWVALEDIKPEAGRLCLVPRSHRPEMWDGLLDEYN